MAVMVGVCATDTWCGCNLSWIGFSGRGAVKGEGAEVRGDVASSLSQSGGGWCSVRSRREGAARGEG
jgi:hypothetical protein